MSFCSVKCAVCGEWMSRTITKRGAPYLYCGRCGVGFMVLRKETAQALNATCKIIKEKDLPPKTLEKHRQRQ